VSILRPYAWANVDGVDGNVPLQAGTIGSDVTRWPNVQTTLTTPSRPGLVDALDPRTAARRVALSCGDDQPGGGGFHRQWDLNVRAVTATADDTVEIVAVSDEVLVEDESPDVDIRPWEALNYTYGYTAGGIARMVLAETGATVADPTPNPSLIPYWELTNKVINPRFQTTTKGAAVGTGTSALASASHVAAGSTSRRALQWTASRSVAGAQVVVAGWDPDAAKMTALPVTQGEWLSVAVDVSAVAPNRGRSLRLTFHDADFIAYEEVTFPPQSAPDTQWVTLVGVLQVGAWDYVSVRVVADTVPSGSDERMFATDVCLVNWDDTIVPFTGATPELAGYTYDWDGETDNSTSTRYPLVPRDPEALVRKAGQGGMSYLVPLLQSVGLRLVHDGFGEWSLRGVDYDDGGTLAIEYGGNMIEADTTISIDDWCDAALVVYTWENRGIPLTKTDYYSAVPTPRKTRYVEVNMAYPGAGRAQNIVTRAQDAARVITATATVNWSAKTEQTATVVTPDATRTGPVGSVEFDIESGQMTVTVRTQEEA
jgi:hypothetical protein